MDPNVKQLYSCADSLVAEFHQGGDVRHIDQAIVLDREALELCPIDHPARVFCLSRLSIDLFTRYQQLGEMKNLNEAIAFGRDALALSPPGDLNRSTVLCNLSVRLAARYDQLGGVEGLDEAIVLAREALSLCHGNPGHPNLQPSSCNLALHLAVRYNELGEVEDLNESITLARDALEHCPPGHPGRCVALNNLSNRLSTRHERLGRMEDLDEPIVLSREALALFPPGHADRSILLNSLASRLSTRYHQLGRLEDLNEAIVLLRDALVLCPPRHPGRSMCLHNLSVHLSIRYNQLRATADLDEAIVLARDALALRPPGHPHRSMSLDHLAIRLCTRYDCSESHRTEDIDEAVDLCRDAVALHQPSHPAQFHSLSNLTGILSVRYQRLGREEDLDWLVVSARAVLEFHAAGHPDRSGSLNNLSVALSHRYNRFGRVEDLDEAIVSAEEALELRQYGHPDRSQPLAHLARYLGSRFTRLKEIQDQERLFSLCAGLEQISETVSSYDLLASEAWVDAAEEFHHPTTVLAYETSLRLLVHHIATLPSLPQHLAVLKTFTSSLAIDAFSACLRYHSPTSAIELLEQGRSVFWSQLARLRSPLDDVIASGPTGKTLADEFTQVTSRIRDAIKSADGDQHDRVCNLNVELRGVVENIRKLPGLSRFLLPSLFSDLRHAACGGPVIVVNASKHGCDALIISLDKDPVHVPLSITKQYVRHLSEKLRTLISRAKVMDVTRDLGPFLRELWDGVVSPIVNALQTMTPFQSRIWWCPTAEFSLLPLHAAGPYRKGQLNLLSLYVSSYAPTLTSLINARRPAPPNASSVTEKKHFVAIGQANASGASELLSVSTELATIGRRVDRLATFTRIEGEEACLSRVAEELRKNAWAHLACHGLPKRKRPFDAAFALRDGHFTVHRIIQCELENPEFAYLSACHTTVGDEESPDEVIHLAAAMQFAGFRSVIGTMWAVDDGETNKITSIFYEHMVDEVGRLDHTRAALALNRTMRSVKMPLDQRILYIHLGA